MDTAPNTTNQTPTPPQQPQPAPPLTPNPGSEDPGKSLGIAGFITSFIGLVGFILSIIALNKSKKAGYQNGLAIAGIVIGAIVTTFLTVILVIATVMAFGIVGQVYEKCNATGAKGVYVEGQYFTCPNPSSASNNTTDTTGENITGTPVTLKEASVDSQCFSFTLPEGYIMSPESNSCQTELRTDNGTSTSIALTSITVKYQTGAQGGVDEFFQAYKSAGGDKVSNERRLTIAGQEGAAIDVVNGTGIPQTVYFVTDPSGKFKVGTTQIDSYVISGPANLPAPLETIVKSFAIK